VTEVSERDQSVPVDEAAQNDPLRPRWVSAVRQRAHSWPGGATLWRVLVAILGSLVVVIGLVLIPLPGPGWAIVFLGVAVWATEFHWASRLLRFGRGVVGAWTTWVLRQGLVVRMLIGLAGLLFVCGVIYLGWAVVLRD
jgi:uncharacterized protein (TIGR02611 family)